MHVPIILCIRRVYPSRAQYIVVTLIGSVVFANAHCRMNDEPQSARFANGVHNRSNGCQLNRFKGTTREAGPPPQYGLPFNSMHARTQAHKYVMYISLMFTRVVPVADDCAYLYDTNTT